MKMRGRVLELDEGSLLTIFSILADADDLARCELVCKRWRRLCWAVPRLNISFEVVSEKGLPETERDIATILRRAHESAPGRLKTLDIDLSCDFPGAKITGHWLASVDSLQVLTLGLDQGCWGPAIWTRIVSACPNLEQLIINGHFTSDFSPTEIWSLTKLNHCEFGNARSVSTELLQNLIRACPALDCLRISGFRGTPGVVEVRNTSLRVCYLFGDLLERRPGGVEVTVRDMPGLTNFGCFGFADKVRTGSGVEKLTELVVDGFCTVGKELSNLEMLRLSWHWKPGQVERLLKLTPRITDLELFMFSGARVGSVLPTLARLKRFVVRSECLHYLDPSVKLEGVTVHLQVNGSLNPDLASLKAMLASGSIEKFVAEVTPTMRLSDPESNEHRQVLAVRDLRKLYPDRVSFHIDKD